MRLDRLWLKIRLITRTSRPTIRTVKLRACKFDQSYIEQRRNTLA